ncbi:MAG: caspase family protein [Proteobacteria bacterium]|nr:caspase family protein [Pseudomonadota bacterium]
MNKLYHLLFLKLSVVCLFISIMISTSSCVYLMDFGLAAFKEPRDKWRAADFKKSSTSTLAKDSTSTVPSNRKRYALVIGNSSYHELGILSNPKNDAASIAERLHNSGFLILRPIRKEQDVQSDLSREEMIIAGETLKQASSGGQMVLLYYAGHGLQLDGMPFLVPVDIIKSDIQNLSTIEGRNNLIKRLVKLDDFIEGLDQQAELAVAIFDACREIPALKTRSLIAGSNTSYRGLASPQSMGKRRVLAFSAGFGELAEDGTGQHSPYTQSFLDEYDQNPNQEVAEFFRRVQSRMFEAIKQAPELSIQGNVPPDVFYFGNGGSH